MSSNRDKDELILNPVTGQLDMVRTFNANRIVTDDLNSAGNPLMVYDMQSGLYVSAGFQIVTDEFGNVILE